MLKKCIGDPESIFPIEGLDVDENLSYEEIPVEILDRQMKNLRNKEVTSVKVLWKNHLVDMEGLGRPEIPLSSSLCYLSLVAPINN